MAEAPPAAPAPQPVQKVPNTWTSIAEAYQEPSPTDSPMLRTADPSNELEGRVHALQSRRLLRSWVRDVFTELDTDHDGRLSEAELGVKTGMEMARAMIVEMDTNRDGKLS